MSTELNDLTEQEANVDIKKREFMDKMGKYALVGAGMATLMTPTASSAGNYGRNNGWGNGDQCSPGRSSHRNRAENDRGRRIHSRHGASNPN